MGHLSKSIQGGRQSCFSAKCRRSAHGKGLRCEWSFGQKFTNRRFRVCSKNDNRPPGRKVRKGFVRDYSGRSRDENVQGCKGMIRKMGTQLLRRIDQIAGM